MIKLVNGQDRASHAGLIDAMFRMRAEVFSARLGWDVTVRDGREMDASTNATRFISSAQRDDGQVEGSLRLLPTTGPNMLRDVFRALLPEDLSSRAPLSGKVRASRSTQICRVSEGMAG